jgi:hypothetical protein
MILPDAFQVQIMSLVCESMLQCAHNQDEPHYVVLSSLKLTTHLHHFMHMTFSYQLHSQWHCSRI